MLTKKTIRSNSFAARLTPEQRDELFEAITAGLSYHDAAKRIRDWITANDTAGLSGRRPARPLKLSEATTIGKWYHATATERRHALVAEVAKVAQSHCPTDYEAQGRRALGQARYLATLEGLTVADIVMLERSELARDKLALEREKLAYQQRRDLVAEKTRLLLARTRGGEKGAELQRQIDLVLTEIESLTHGDTAISIRTQNVELQTSYIEIPMPQSRLPAPPELHSITDDREDRRSPQPALPAGVIPAAMWLRASA